MVSTWNELRIHNQLCDGVIKTSDEMAFPIHRVILSASSPYFRAYFTNSLNNGDPEFTELVISDTSSEIVSLIIEYAYTRCCAVTMDNVHALMIAADKFSCEALVKYCSELIWRNVNYSNCVSTYRFSENYFSSSLQMKTWNFIIDNIEDVMYSVEFDALTVDELVKILEADELNVRFEDTVFDVIARWILVDPPSRKQEIARLMHCIRFGLVTVECYIDVIKAYEHHTKESLDLLSGVDPLFQYNEETYLYHYYYFRPRIPNEVVFAFGGWSEGTPTNVIETYDKKSDGWYLSSIRDHTIRAYHGAVVLNNLIYVVGGFNGTEYFSTMHCFDPATYQWTEKACMHDVRCYVSICALGEEIYAIGGFNGRTRLSSAERYDPKTNQWTMIAPLNKHRSDSGAAALNGKVFVAGGFNGQEVLRSVEMYNPDRNQWDFVDYMSSPRSGVSMIAHGQYIYALGGFDGVDRLYSCERYNPQYNRWDSIADMCAPRSNMASVVLDKCILVIGGFNGYRTTSYTEYYDETENKWYESASLNVNRSALSACVCRGLPNAKSYTFLGNERYSSSSTEGSEGELIRL